MAVNLSDAFTFEEQERQASDSEGLEMKAVPPKNPPSDSRDPSASNETLVNAKTDATEQSILVENPV